MSKHFNKNYNKILTERFGKILSKKLVSKWRQVYRIETKLGAKRLDVLHRKDKTLSYHQTILDNGLKFVADIEAVIPVGDHVLKISEWIDGKFYDDLYKQEDLQSKMFLDLGRCVGKLNNITNKRGHCLHNDDITMRNIIWDGSCRMFDLDRLDYESVPENSMVKILLKRLRYRDFIDWFLEGYSEYRNADKIIDLCASRDWIW